MTFIKIDLKNAFLLDPAKKEFYSGVSNNKTSPFYEKYSHPMPTDIQLKLWSTAA